MSRGLLCDVSVFVTCDLSGCWDSMFLVSVGSRACMHKCWLTCVHVIMGINIIHFLIYWECNVTEWFFLTLSMPALYTSLLALQSNICFCSNANKSLNWACCACLSAWTWWLRLKSGTCFYIYSQLQQRSFWGDSSLAPSKRWHSWALLCLYSLYPKIQPAPSPLPRQPEWLLFNNHRSIR
jgi:hypothetical protein